MEVIKRNGSREALDIAHVRKQTIAACEGLINTSYEELEFGAQVYFKDGIKTSEIQDALIESANNLLTVKKPNYTYVAARLKLFDMYHKIKHMYGKKVPGSVYKLIHLSEIIQKNSEIWSDWCTKYSMKEIDELHNEIVPDRDLLFDYTAVVTLKDRYLARRNGSVVELPQHMHMFISMFIMQDEEPSKRLQLVKDLYNMTSKLLYIHPTPMNANGRIKNGGLISCLLTSVADSMDGIADKWKEVAIGSKIGSGWGIDMSRIRSIGSDIDIRKNAAGGKIPFIKVFNDIAVAVDQGGKRRGAFTIYIEAWDIEYKMFLDLRKTNGDDRRRAQDTFLALNIPDLFMEREAEDGEWTLFDPRDVPLLTETWGDEFKKNYLKYEEEFKNKTREFNPNTVTVRAKDIIKDIIISYNTTGMPFLHFRDASNRSHRWSKELGIIRQSNLCMEVLQPTDENNTAVCNLGSLNLARLAVNNDAKDPRDNFENVVKLGVRAMDNAINLTEYPSEIAKKTQFERRSIGLGLLGESEYLAHQKVMYGSDEHKAVAEDIYSRMAKYAEEATIELAKEKGSCIIEGRRNAYLMAIAPNSTSGILAGTTPGVEPVFNRIWKENNKTGSVWRTAPNVTPEIEEFYRNPYEIDMVKQLEVNGIRQKYIDMGISQNLYLDPNGLKASRIRECIVAAWKNGLKTLYYLRSQPPKTEACLISDPTSCKACAN